MSETHTNGASLAPADALWQLYQMDSSAEGGHPTPGPERSALEAAAGSKIMTRYQYNWWMKKQPVAQLQDGKCSVCGTRYHANHELAQLAGSGEVRGCYTCGRLLVFVTISPE